MQISLRKTLIVYTTFVVVLVACAVTVSTLRATRKAVIDSNDRYAKNLTKVIATLVADSEFLRAGDIHGTLRQIAEGNVDLNAVAIYDLKLERIAEFSSNRQTVLIVPQMQPPLRSFQSAYRMGHFSVVGPVIRNGEVVNYIGADFSLSRSSILVRSAARNAAVVLVVCVSLATLLATLLAWKVTNPIFRLINAAKRISKRQFDLKLQPTRQQELQQLQDQIQSMVDELRNTTVSRDYVDRIFNSMRDGLIVATIDGKLRSANPAMTALVGREEDEILAVDLGDLIVDHRGLPYHPDETPDQEDREGIDGHCLRADGSQIPVSITYNPIITEEQQLEGFVIGVKDITLRKQTEETLDEAIRKAEQASRVKSEFLANMSHELRTPMNSILGFTRRLITKIGDQIGEQHKDALITVDRNAIHLLGLINDILDLSKIEAGKMDLKVTRFDLTGVLRDVIEQTAPLTDGRPIDMTSELCDSELLMDGDRVKTVQIVTNLISNAIKYTEQGSVVVRLHRDDKQPNQAIVEIADTGVGIKEEDRIRLFRKFSQLDGTTTRKVGGTGLGLFITAQYIAMHGGTIDVDSVHGEGSTFKVTFPVILPAEPLPAETRSAETLAAGGTASQVATAGRTPDTEQIPVVDSGSPSELGATAANSPFNCPSRQNSLTVLCVDDDLDTRKFLQVTLEDYGFRVITADGYDSALSLAKACRPDLVCLDMKMPDKDGTAVMEAFALDDELKHLPVIVVSGESPESLKSLGRESLSNGFVAKPIDPNHLVHHIHNALANRLDSVLIVEDNDDTQRLLKQSFEDHGTRVLQASNGREAVEILKYFHPSAIVTDLTMPVMDGVEFLKTLQLDKDLSRIPVIVLTARSLEGEARESLSNLCHQVFTKGRDSTAHILVAAIQGGNQVGRHAEATT